MRTDGLSTIEARDLTKIYEGGARSTTAVHTASFVIRGGEFVSLVGHSGSGKSSLLAMIGGILRPDSGTVVMNGRDLWRESDDDRSRLRGERIGFVYQFASLIPTLTAEENVLLPALFRGRASLADAERLLELVGLGSRLKSYPSELSGGEQQRVAIARAFINDPLLLLADEPTGDLDEETEGDIMGFFERVNRDKKVTILMVTHSTDLAGRASRRFRMRHGVVEEIR